MLPAPVKKDHCYLDKGRYGISVLLGQYILYPLTIVWILYFCKWIQVHKLHYIHSIRQVCSPLEEWSLRVIKMTTISGIFKLQLLEPVCCKKQKKKVPDQLLVCRIGDLWRTWMIPNWLYMSPSDSPDHLGSILYHSESSGVPYSPN